MIFINVTKCWLFYVAIYGDVLRVKTVVCSPRSMWTVTERLFIAVAVDVVKPDRSIARSVRVANNTALTTEQRQENNVSPRRPRRYTPLLAALKILVQDMWLGLALTRSTWLTITSFLLIYLISVIPVHLHHHHLPSITPSLFSL